MAKISSKQPASKNNATPQTSEAYDQVPYDSKAFPQTNPLLLQGIARLFGLNAPSPDKARVLEIGCSSAGNIMAIASIYPESKCVGIDYSPRQVEEAHKAIEAVGLTNLEVKLMSVTDVDKSLGTFDYIICHGVMAWVLHDIQEKIFEVCKNNLSEDGIAYISYNTLPGWNNVQSIRDMMIYHTERFPEPQAKAQQARQLLNFISDAMKERQNPMADFVNREKELLATQPDFYLLHDHLEEYNFPFYFHEFMSRADKHGLQYLADTSVETMFSGNFGPGVAEVLATSNDIVRTEQYMDFIYNRRFRSTMLCHKERILSRNLQPGMIKDGWLISRFNYPEGFDKFDLANRVRTTFRSVSEMTLSTDDPLVLAMLQCFMEHGTSPIKVSELVKNVREKLKKAKIDFKEEQPDGLDNAICTFALRHIFIGGYSYYTQNTPYLTTVSKKPAVTKLARVQAGKQMWITNQRQETIQISAFDKIFAPYVDGTRDAKALEDAMLPHFVSKELTMNENNLPVTDMKEIEDKMPRIIEHTLKRYADLAMLVK